MSQMTDQPGPAATFERLLGSGQLAPWLQQLLTALHDGQDPATAARWGQRIADSLLTLRRAEGDGQLPFEVVHDWQARCVVPLMLQAAAPAGNEPASVERPASGSADGEPMGKAAMASLPRMHERAAAGERFGEADWRAAIEPALRQLYRHAYGYAEAYATARASASAYASANDFSEQGALEFADSYAKLSTDANRQSYTEANAVANAALLAAAYASGDLRAYAQTYPFALAHACAHAYANSAGQAAATEAGSPGEIGSAGGQPGPAERRQAAYTRLAGGLADSLSRILG